MGTTFTVKVVAQNLSEEQLDALRRAVESELENVNSKMSTYLPESELSRFNAFRLTDPFPVSKRRSTFLSRRGESVQRPVGRLMSPSDLWFAPGALARANAPGKRPRQPT